MADQEGGLSGDVPAGRLLLIRHGETQWSRDRRHTGSTDVALTALGEQQALSLAPMLQALRPAAVLCSPRQRAVRTAELAGLAGRAGLTLDEDLAEWGYGDFEGITTAQIRESHPGWTLWTSDPPGGETAEAVARRADRVLTRIVAELQHGDVVVVGHGHFSRVLAARWLGLPARAGQHFALDTATVCVLGFEHEYPVLWRWNLPAASGAPAW